MPRKCRILSNATKSREDVFKMPSDESNAEADSDSADNIPLRKHARLKNRTNTISPISVYLLNNK